MLKRAVLSLVVAGLMTTSGLTAVYADPVMDDGDMPAMEVEKSIDASLEIEFEKETKFELKHPVDDEGDVELKKENKVDFELEGEFNKDVEKEVDD